MNSNFWTRGFLNAHEGEDSQNAVEFTILWARLTGKYWKVSDQVLKWVENADRSEEKRHGKFRLGHDNLTSTYSFLGAAEKMRELRKEVDLWYRLDSQYYHIQEGKRGLWRYLLLSIALIYGAVIPWKFRKINGQWYRFKKTDGLLLTWLRFKGGLHMPFTKTVVNLFVKLYFGSWKGVFTTYFTKGHDLTLFESGEYEL